MKLHRLFTALLFAGLAATAFAQDPVFERWAGDLAAQMTRANPQSATANQYFSGAEQDALDRELTPVTRAYRAARVAEARQALAELARFDRSRLDATQRASAAMIEWSRRLAVETDEFADYNFVFNQFNGLQVTLVNFLTITHPVRNRRDVENYLARLGQVAARID